MIPDDKTPDISTPQKDVSMIIYDNKIISPFQANESLPIVDPEICGICRMSKIPVKSPESISKRLFISSIVILAILFVALIALLYFDLNSKLDSTNNNLNSKLDSTNNLLNLQSESHFINIQSNIAKSIVIIESPIPTNYSSSANSEDIIYLDNNGQSWKIGTGFSVDDKGHILTANHVIDGAQNVIISYSNGVTTTTIPAIGSMRFPDLDMAILYADLSIPPVTIQGQDMNSHIGSTVGFIGYPLISPVNGIPSPIETTTRGTVSGLIPFTYQNQQVPVYVIGANANHGNSGGPVFSLGSGEVIGIINQKVSNMEGMAISTAIDQNLINSMIKAINNNSFTQGVTTYGSYNLTY